MSDTRTISVLENYVRSLVQQKNYSGALHLVEQLDGETLDDLPSWFARGVKAKHRAQKDYFSYQTTLEKIRGRLPDSLSAYEITAMKSISGGIISFAINQYRLQAKDHRRDVVEKIYHKRATLVASERWLYENCRIADYGGPEYLGHAQFGDFESIFLTYYEHDETVVGSFKEKLPEIIARLWRNRWQKEALQHKAAADKVTLRHDTHLNNVSFDNLQSSLAECAFTHIDLNHLFPKVMAAWNDSDVFIMHSNLDPSNVRFQPDGFPVLIDWDKWSVEKVGTGLSFKDVGIDIERIASFRLPSTLCKRLKRISKDKIDTEILSNFVFWNIAVGHKDMSRKALGKLLKCLNDIHR